MSETPPSLFDSLVKRNCPVCDAASDAALLFLDKSYDSARIDSFSFASRKTPELMSYRLVKCSLCETIYAEAAPPAAVLQAAYTSADYDSGVEAALAATTYMHALAAVPAKGRVLEIGCGTGVLLDLLLQAGFDQVTGVEPSAAAIAAAPSSVRRFIQVGFFDEVDFEPASFSLICCFMTLEHVSAPRELTRACFNLLAPGGTLAVVTHDYSALLNRLLGRRSPIIDIEHLQIFCPASLSRLLGDSGFSEVCIAPLVNRYPIRYWARLAPLPARLKSLGLEALRRTGLGRVELAIAVGNVMAFGRRPNVADAKDRAGAAPWSP